MMPKGYGKKRKQLARMKVGVPGKAPPSIVELLLNKEHDKEAWLQKPGEHSFSDAMGGTTRYTSKAPDEK
jgi:hypothetical protein